MQEVDERTEVAYGQYFEAICKRRLCRVGVGHDHPRVAGCPRRESAGEHSPDRSQGSAQGQLTADGDVR